MTEEILKRKKQLIRRFGIRTYDEIMSFMERIYLSDHDLVVLKARKMSNLFMALLPVLKEENGGRIQRLYEEKFAARRKPVIVTDWALEHFSKQTEKVPVESVLLVDDVIIHGRTIAQLYIKTKELFEADIKITAFARNSEDVLEKDYIKKADVLLEKPLETCRSYSKKFVDIFALLLQPYTSYVPNIVFRDLPPVSREIKDSMGAFMTALKSENAYQIKFEHNHESYIKTEAFCTAEKTEFRNILAGSHRCYYSPDLDDYALIPMVSLKPLEASELQRQLQVLAKESVFAGRYDERYVEGTFIPNISDYRVLVYTLSLLWGRLFRGNSSELKNLRLDMEEIREAEAEEERNFGEVLIRRDIIDPMNKEDIKAILDRIEGLYVEHELTARMASNEHYQKLKEILEQSIKERVKGTTNYEADDNCLYETVRSFLKADGDLDEADWKQKRSGISDEVPERLPGLPLVMMMDSFEKNGIDVLRGYCAVLSAVDQGIGSIVPDIFQEGEEQFFVSSIHAGEQSYLDTEEKYFPILYGLFLLESEGKNRKSDPADNKREFLRAFSEKKEGLSIGKEGSDEWKMLAKINVSKEYKEPLLQDFFFFEKEKDLIFALEEAEHLIQHGEWK